MRQDGQRDILGGIERGNKSQDVWIALGTFFAQRFEDGLLDMGWQISIIECWQWRGFRQVLKAKRKGIRGGEGQMARQEFIGYAAKGVLISFLAQDALELLWCHIRS